MADWSQLSGHAIQAFTLQIRCSALLEYTSGAQPSIPETPSAQEQFCPENCPSK
jgi:hypothetical protein